MTDSTSRHGSLFDEVAERFDRYRPDYSEALVTDVLTMSGAGHGSQVLEIGCGTGKATRAFAAHGLDMTCLDPGEEMLTIARRRADPSHSIRFVADKFEEFELPRAKYDLVFSAQAFHWVDPAVGFVKAARALRRSGGLALFWYVRRFLDRSIRAGLDQAYRTHARKLKPPAPGVSIYGGGDSVFAAITATGLYRDLEERRYVRSESYSADDWVAHLSTMSDHIAMPPDAREALLSAIHDVITRNGGSIDVKLVTNLNFAKRND